MEQLITNQQVGGSSPSGCTNNFKMKTIFANTWDELTLKMLGYYHDHCWHKFAGHVSNVPDKFKYLLIEDQEYVFIYEEDKLNI